MMQAIRTEVYFSFLFTITFFILSLVVLRKSRSETNLMFALGSTLFGFGTFFAGLGYIVPEQQLTLWSLGTAILILSPIGYFTSARQIITGSGVAKDTVSLLLIVVFFFLSLLMFILYPSLNENLRVVIGDSFLILALLLALSQFYIIFSLSPSDLKLKLFILMAGIGLAVIFLVLNVILSLDGNGSSLYRYVFPLIGNLLVVLSFIAVPSQEPKA